MIMKKTRLLQFQVRSCQLPSQSTQSTTKWMFVLFALFVSFEICLHCLFAPSGAWTMTEQKVRRQPRGLQF